MKESVFGPIFGSAHGHDLLGENVHRGIRNGDAVQIALAHGVNERGVFDEIVARGGEEAAFRDCSTPVTGATDALKTDRDGTRRADLADEVNAADIDSELERSRGDQGADFSRFELAFRGEAQLARETPVMCGHGFAPEAFG